MIDLGSKSRFLREVWSGKGLSVDARRQLLSLFVPICMFSVLVVVGTIHIVDAPPIWWDEGWTLSVARNWLESQHYGRLSLGMPSSADLAAAFPLVGLVASSFFAFGVGIWQGRLVGLVFTIGLFVLIYLIANRHFGQKIAYGSIFVLVFLYPHPMISPLLNGRQVLADIPVSFFLFAGYLTLTYHFEKSSTWYYPTVIFWGLALFLKLQMLPFWLIGMFAWILVALYRRQYFALRRAILYVLGPFAVYFVLSRVQGALAEQHFGPSVDLGELITVVAFVRDTAIRWSTLSRLFLLALPSVLGLAFIGKMLVSRRDIFDLNRSSSVLTLTLFTTSAAWILWYALLSNGGIRYLASPVALSGIFVAVMLADFTDGFNLAETIRRGAGLLKLQEVRPSGVTALFAILLVVPLSAATVLVFVAVVRNPDDSAIELAHFINSQAPVDALVETYDSEIFFLLDRPYHFPPDQLHADYLRRFLLDPDLVVEYDALEFDPDYLVIGPLSSEWRVYDETLNSGEFLLIQEFTRYKVYERIR